MMRRELRALCDNEEGHADISVLVLEQGLMGFAVVKTIVSGCGV